MTSADSAIEYTPFCLFRTPKSGGRVLWQITNKCNYSCTYCIFASGKLQDTANELTTSEALKYLDELSKAGFTHIKFSGGEPLMRQDMIGILAAARQKGFTCDLSTNASLVDQSMAEKLAQTGVSMLHVGLDGSSEMSQQPLRGRGTFSKSLRGIEHLVKNNLYVRIGCVVSSANQHLLQEMVRLAFSSGAKEIIFSRMEPAGRLKASSPLITNKSDAELREEVEKLGVLFNGRIVVTANFRTQEQGDAENVNAQKRLCPGGKTFLYIDQRGRLSPCTWLSESGLFKACSSRLAEKSLVEVFSEPVWKYFHDSILQGALQQKGGCPLRWS